MKLLSYTTDEGFRELTHLVIKIMQTGKSIAILSKNLEVAQLISENFWKASVFVPHGIEGEEFESIQPILITTKLVARKAIINFEDVIIKHTNLEMPPEIFILWNCMPYSNDFIKYKQNPGSGWVKI